jgi:predicted SnoaL-like aldol condensation-catalyzing enzyme
MTDESEHERTLMRFYRLFYNDKRFAEAAALLTEGFVNHHPGAHGVGRQGMVDDFGRFARTVCPEFRIDVRRCIARGEFVWTHSLVTGLPGGRRVVSVDIWRFEQGAIAEHWDVGQALAPDQDADAMFADGAPARAPA